MQTILYDVELWREYAKQMHSLSRRATDPRIRQRALAAAAGFERIAELASKMRTNSEQRRRWGRAA